jgi:hypothetical protein
LLRVRVANFRSVRAVVRRPYRPPPAYREYDFVTRQVMRMRMQRVGHPTEASHDDDYTDWDGVGRPGRVLAQSVRASDGVAP